VLDKALLVVGHLVAVKMVVGVHHVDVRHPHAAQRHQVVSVVEALQNPLFYVDVLLKVSENIRSCVATLVHWSETHLKRALVTVVLVYLKLSLIAGYQVFGLHCSFFDLPGKNGVVG
jgi:hypothetical protein